MYNLNFVKLKYPLKDAYFFFNISLDAVKTTKYVQVKRCDYL